MLENLNYNQKKVLIIIVIIIVFGVFYYIYFKSNNNQIDLNQEIMVQKNNTSDISQENEEENFVIIHITGSIKTPGIVKLKDGARIEDAIEAAGGLTEDADISNLNLAYILEDGTKLKIPSLLSDEESKDEQILSKESGKNIIEESKVNLEEQSNTAININKASQSEFEKLPGIGPSLAQKIIKYRNEIKKFEKIEDIKNVSGIGESKFENFKNYIYVK